MITFPLALKPAPSAVHEPAGWFIAGADPAAWLDEVARWGLPTEGLKLYVLPASVRDRTPLGVLVVGPAGATPRSVLRAQPYGRLAGRLFLPADAVLQPPVSEAELRDTLRLDVLVLHPAAGLVGFKQDEALAVHDLLAPPARREADWGRAVEAEGSRWRLVSVEPEDVPRIQEILEQGRGDIGTEAPGSLPPAPDESRLQDLKDALSRAGRPGLKLLRWLTSRAPGGVPSPAWVERMSQWASRKLSQMGSSLEAARLKELERLRKMLESDPDEGLRHAIPLRDVGTRGVAPPGARLTPRDVNFNLSGVLGGGGFAADTWHVPLDYTQVLMRQYREAANRELRLGRHRRAAYIFAQLLGDYAAAANALEQGRHYREAAALYTGPLKNPRKAAECMEQGGLLVEAIRLYEDLQMFEKAGDLSARIERPEEAERFYRAQVRADLERGDRLKAAGLLENKLAVPDEALDVLTRAWPEGDAAGACLRASFQLLARLARHDEADSRIHKLRAEAAPPGRGPVLAQVLADVATTYPEQNVRTAGADATRVVAGVQLSDASVTQGDRQALARAVGRLAPEDRLLARDVERFLARPKVPPPVRAAPRKRGVGDPVILRQFPLPSGVNWMTAVATGLGEGQAGGEGFYAFGVSGGGLYLARGGWDGRTQRGSAWLTPPRAPDVDWALHPVPGKSQVTVTPPHELNVPFEFPQGETFPAPLEANFPAWLPAAGLLGLCHSEAGFTWTLHAHTPGEVVLSAYRTSDGLLVASHAHHDLPPLPDGQVQMVFRSEHVYATWNTSVLRFGPVTGLRVEPTPGTVRHLAASRPDAEPRVAVSMEDGCLLLHVGGRHSAFGAELQSARIAFTRGGLIVAADARAGRVYRAGGPTLCGQFPSPGAGLIALTPTRRLDEFAAFTDDGKVTVYQVPG